MRRFSSYLVCAPIVVAAVLALAACKGSSEGSSAEEAEGEQTAAESKSAARDNEPGPPDSYVRHRCGVCSCRVFTGEGAHCRRPSCEHHWTEHQRPSD